MDKTAKSQGSPGPDPERIKIDGDWEDAVKRAVDVPPTDVDETDGESSDSADEGKSSEG